MCNFKGSSWLLYIVNIFVVNALEADRRSHGILDLRVAMMIEKSGWTCNIFWKKELQVGNGLNEGEGESRMTQGESRMPSLNN